MSVYIGYGSVEDKDGDSSALSQSLTVNLEFNDFFVEYRQIAVISFVATFV